MIRIANIKTDHGIVNQPNVVRVDRKTAYGNPHPMSHDTPTEREFVIDKYRKTMTDKILTFSQTDELIDAEKSNVTTTLACWCYPLHCHADVIAETIRRKAKTTINRIIIAGTREFDDANYGQQQIAKVIDETMPNVTRWNTEIISGRCKKGGDRFGEIFAKNWNVPCRFFPADWDTHGKAAGPIRNNWMAKFAIAETPNLIAFWNGKKQGGTWNMIETAEKYHIPVTIVHV